MSKSIYRLVDHSEHGARLPEWRDRWIANAMSTIAMTEDDREACIVAVNGMYAAAKLPAPKHIVFVPSPFVLAFAGGFAASIWHTKKNGAAATHAATYAATDAATDAATRAATDAATYAATYAATRAATDAATRAATDAATRAATDAATYAATHAATDAATYAATHAATYAATDAATDAATRAATDAATYAATYAATDAATDAATRAATDAATDAATHAATDAATYAATDAATDLSKWYVVPGDMRRVADELGVGDFGLRCAAMAWQMRQGGNQWSAWDSFLTFFQDVAELPLDYSAYTHWRTLAERSGPRIMHADFCMISDRPELLTVDDANRPHGEDGPFCQWRDGSALYAWHGTHVPARWIEERATLDPAEVIRAENVEHRAAGASIVGWPKMLSVLKSKVIDDSGSPDIGELIELELPGLDQPGRFLKAACPRNGIIVEGVPYISDIDNLPINTAIAAQAWRIGDPQSEYAHPPMRT